MIPTGRDLKRLRELAGLTQSELAKRIGVSQSLIAKIESGKIDPKLSIVKRIIEELVEEINVNETVKKVMTTPVIVADEDEDVKSIIEKMERYGISQLPVVDKDGKVKGMVYDFV
ncbi:MAG: helix-turn-helix domain-containing protein, partial [Sulfolobaceae archaeon]